MKSPGGLICLAVVSLMLVACNREAPQDAAGSGIAAAPAAQQPDGKMREAPDFGGVGSISREADGIGSTPELAVLAALQSLVAQVNGTRVASQMQVVRAGMQVVANGRPAGSVSGEAFVQEIVTASQGTVLGYEIVSQEEVQQVDSEMISRVRASDEGYSYSASASASGQASASVRAGDDRAEASVSGEQASEVEVKRGASSYESDQHYKTMRSYWKVRIRADLAKYRAPEEKGRPKIVVAPPRTLSKSYEVGDTQVAADEVARAIRGRLSDTLTQTRRFMVLDRELSQEMQAEIDHINSGNVRAIDSARLGQQLATDLILVPTIERFAYPRSVRQLRMSTREVSSYSGGGRITLKLVNAGTGEVVLSESFEHQLSPTGPSTLPRVVDGVSLAGALMDELSADMGAAIISEIFPVSVIAVNGDQVVLSQGGESLREGERYQAAILGEALTDPQTGLSLGRMESDCCVIRVVRVSQQTSYGVIEEGKGVLGGVPFQAGSIELKQKLAGAVGPAPTSAPEPTAAPAPAIAGAAPRQAAPARQAEPLPERQSVADEDDNW